MFSHSFGGWKSEITVEFLGGTIQSTALHPWPAKIMSLLQSKYTDSIPVAPKVLTHFNINSKVQSLI